MKSGSVTQAGLLGPSGSSTHISPQWSSTVLCIPFEPSWKYTPYKLGEIFRKNLELEKVITFRSIMAQIGKLREKGPSALMLLIVEIRSIWVSCRLEPYKFWSSSMGKTQLWPHQLHSKPGCPHFTFLVILDPKISPSPRHHSAFQKSLLGVAS